jgi:hypothetical protein
MKKSVSLKEIKNMTNGLYVDIIPIISSEEEIYYYYYNGVDRDFFVIEILKGKESEYRLYQSYITLKKELLIKGYHAEDNFKDYWLISPKYRLWKRNRFKYKTIQQDEEFYLKKLGELIDYDLTQKNYTIELINQKVNHVLSHKIHTKDTLFLPLLIFIGIELRKRYDEDLKWQQSNILIRTPNIKYSELIMINNDVTFYPFYGLYKNLYDFEEDYPFSFFQFSIENIIIDSKIYK